MLKYVRDKGMSMVILLTARTVLGGGGAIYYGVVYGTVGVYIYIYVSMNYGGEEGYDPYENAR